MYLRRVQSSSWSCINISISASIIAIAIAFPNPHPHPHPHPISISIPPSHVGTKGHRWPLGNAQRLTPQGSWWQPPPQNTKLMAYLRPLEPELSDGRDEHGIMNGDEILQELSNAGLIERVAIPVHSQTPSQRDSHSSGTLQDPDEEPGRVVLDL